LGITRALIFDCLDSKNPNAKMELDMSALAGMGGARPKPPSYEEVMGDLKQKAIIMGVAIFAIRVAPYVINAVQILTSKAPAATH
jgi:hypothetical protein